MTAGFTKTPEFQLSPQESKALTEALADVLDKHEISVTGGVSVEVTLIMTVLMIEKPRIDALRRNALARKNRVPEPAPVIENGSHYF